VDASIDIPINRFTSLVNSGSATMLVLLKSLGLTKGAVLTINEVDESLVPTGRIGTGVVAAIASGQFYSLQTGYNQYYINPLNMSNWVDYSAISTINGFAAFTYKIIQYKIEGDTMFIIVFLFGSSSGTAVNFTLPVVASSSLVGQLVVGAIVPNGGGVYIPNINTMNASLNKVTCYSNMTTNVWSGTGSRIVTINGFFKI